MKNLLETELLKNGYALLNNIEYNTLESESLKLGEILPQYNNEKMFEVSYDKDIENIYYSKSQKIIAPHIDGHDYKIPPKYMMFYCVKASIFNDGYTQISDSKTILNQLSTQELDIITKPIFNFISKPGEVKSNNILHYLVPIYDIEKDIFRYSYNYLSQIKDNYILKIIEHIKEIHYNNLINFKIPENSVLIVNNHRFLHSRTEFKDINRKLIRIWIK